jgi:hypothetical protein
MFVGDSLGRNQWESLVCMISAAAPTTQLQSIRGDPLSTFKFLVSVTVHSLFSLDDFTVLSSTFTTFNKFLPKKKKKAENILWLSAGHGLLVIFAMNH